MADRKIKITTEFLAQLKGMDDVVSKMKTGLQDANKEAIKSTNFTKLFSDYTDEYKKFKSFIGSDGIDILDSKEALRSGEKIIKFFKQIQSNYGDLSNMDVNLAKKLFPSEFTGQAKKAQEAIEKYESATEKINNLEINLQGQRIELERLRNAAEAAKDQLNAINYTPGDLEKLRTDSANAALEVEKLQKQLRQKLGLDENADLEEELAKIKKNKEEYEKAQQAKKDYAKNYGDNKTIKEIREEKKELEELISLMKKRKELSEPEKERFSELSKKTGITNQAEAGKKTKTLNAQIDYLSMADTSNIDIPDEEINKMSEELEKASIKSAQLKKSLEETGKEAIKFAKAQKDYGDKNAAYEKTKLSVEQLDQQLTDLKNSQGNITALFNTLNQINANPEKLAATSENLEKIKKNLSNMDETTKNRIVEKLQEMGLSAEQAERLVDELRNSFRGMGDEAKEISKAEQEMENLKKQMFQFVGLTNSINLFKRTVQSALATVKELDAVMTETAVVTDFTIGDMWEKLPEYSAEATKLGASIRDLYGATTLYYQQGLQTEEAMSVGIETMKMARIAGMEAADATEAMTAALRGFNMEVNETNAVRVNDVYSELAAITAADTEQIATAMSKTASIAASANMEFETTAALLAQIIETTQEAPETAGTAMKTIIARFTEVKELFSEGMLTGEDSEGEEININKIDAALKTVGISLKDFLNGQKGIDDIFLELASKWDGLDLATQRYIATMAAGSRQQSRFIAMMSNYDRTMELVTAANNSAGASQEQFDKTLESMEAKLQKLKNAWDEFTMGLANNEILKFGVDLLTGFLETVNKLTDALSGGNGLVKSVISLITVIGALKGGNALLSGLFGKENEQGTGLFSKFFNKKKEGGSSKSSENQNRKQGEKDGKAYMSGRNRAVEQGKKKGFKAGLKGFFTQEISKKTEGIDQEKLLGSIEKKFLETDINSTLSDELATLHQSLDQGGISAEKAGAKFKELGGDLQGTEPVIKSTSVDLQSVGQATMAVGGAVGLLSVLFENMGWEEGVEGASAVSAALVTLGGVLSGLPSIISFVGSVATATGISVQAAWIWVVGIVTVIGLIVGAVVAMNNAAKEKSLENRMKKAAEATKAAKETATQTREAYDNLLNEKNKYTELQKTLSGLTEGTNDWKMALIEANQQVLSLLSTYPVLAQYLGRGEDGQLIIQAGGWDAALEKQMEAVQASQASVFAAQIAESQLQLENAERNLQKQFKNRQTWETAQGDVGIVKYGRDAMAGAGETDSFIYEKATMDQMLEADFSTLFSRGENGEFSTELQELAGGSTIAAEELYNLKDALIEYKASVEATKTQMQLYGESLVDSITSEQTKESEFYDIVKSYFGSESQIENLSKEALSMAKSLTGPKGGGATKDNALVEEIATHYKVSAQMTNDSLGNLRTIYAAAAGIDRSKVNESLTEDQLAQEITTRYTNEIKGAEIARLDQAFNKITDETERKYAIATLTNDFSGLTQTEIDKYGSKAKSAEEYAKMMGLNSPEELASLLGFEEGQSLLEYSSTLDGADLQNFLNSAELENLLNGNEQLLAAYGGRKWNELTETEKHEFIGSRGEYIQYIIPSVEALNKSIGDFSDAMKNKKPTIADSTSDIFENLGFQGKNLTIGAQDAFAKKLQTMYLDQGSFIGAIDIANRVAEVKDPKLQQQLTDVLNTMDWTSITSIEQLDEKLAELGWTSEDLSKYGITELQKELEEFAKQSKYFTLDELKNQIKSTEELIKDIEGREYTERAFTKEDYEKIINLKPEMKSQFVMTGIDEFTYIGDSMQTLVEALQDNTAAELQSYGEQIKERGETSQKWLDYEKRGNWDLKNTAETEKLTDIQLFEKIASKEINAQDFINATDTDTGYNSLIEAMYIRNMGDMDYLKSLNGEELTTLITDQMALHYGDEGTKARTNVAEASSWAENQAYIDKVKVLESGQGLIVEETNTEAYEQQKTAIDAVALSTEGAMGQYAKWMNKMKDPSLKNKEAELKQLAILSTKYANSVDDLAEALSDEIDVLKKGDKAGDKYWKALEKIAAKAQKVFGPKVNAEYVAANKDLFVQLAKGGKEGVKAFKQIAKASIAEYLNTFNKANLSKETLAAIGSKLTEENLDSYIQKFITTEELPLNVPIDVDSLKEKYGEALVDLLKDPNVQELLKYNGMVFSTGADGKTFVTKAEDGSTGFKINNTGSGSKTKWKNPYDEFYNTVEDINEELRTREKLERRYQALLDKTGTKASDLAKNAKDQLNSLEKQKKMREGLLENRKGQMSDIESEYSSLSKYAWYNEQDGTIEIDWEKINKLDGSTNEKLTSRIEEYIGKLEEQQELIESEEDELDAIEESLREIRDQGKDEYFDLEAQIKEALIDSRQQEIDRLSEINDSINDTNSRLIDAMQSSIDKYRQDRENEKTEEELADKQRRLAYLQQDTSGANALDIMQLQEEIDQAQEDYTDTLIDQKISELQQQNDEAAEQRQKQIDIMNDQLQHDIATGAIWDKVYELMGSGIDKDGIKVGSSLWELLKDQQEYPSKSNLEKLDWAENLRDLAAQAVQWLSVGNSTEALIASGDLQKGQKITFKTADGKTVEGKLQDNGDIIADGKTYKDVRRNYDGSFVTEENYQDKETKIATTTSTSTSTTNTNSTKTNKQTNKGKSKVNKFSFNGVNYSSKTAALEAINRWETDQISWAKIRWFQGEGNHSESYLDSRLKTIRTQASTYRNKLNLHKFKTGGLADFTGPAWLDGTKSKPEYILNSDQTKAFFELVDVLSGLKSGVTTSSQINGDSIYDIDINVESIGSDYDVEQLAQTVKRMINDDARYRNNNAINLSR